MTLDRNALGALLMAWACSLLLVGAWSHSLGLTTSLQQTDAALWTADMCMVELRGMTEHLESLLPTWEANP